MRQLRHALAIAAGIVFGAVAADSWSACGPYMPWDTVGQATCAPLDEAPRAAPARAPVVMDPGVAAQAYAAYVALEEAEGVGQPPGRRRTAQWPAPALVVPADGRTRSYQIMDESGFRSGWVEMEATGDYRQWDNRSGWRSGRIEVQE